MHPVVEALSLLTPYDIDKPKIRIGPDGDGGYILVDDISVHQNVISYGISVEYSFDKELAENGHHVYMFDHTIGGIHASNSNMHFFKEGVAGTTDASQSLFSIEDHLHRHQIAGDRLILKMDVEGAEFDAFNAISDKTLNRFEQIVLEVHNVHCLEDAAYRASFCGMFRKINRFFTLFHVHANNCDGPNGLYIVSGIPVSGIIELSYIKSHLVHRRPSQTLYPTTIDYPNTNYRDKLLWFFPFVPTALTLENFAACEERVEFLHRLRLSSQTQSLPAVSTAFVNIAQGKPASQSSFSEWSSPTEAVQAVSGSMPLGFAFHTDVEDHAWWQVDLLAVYPIESIVVHNRLDILKERARSLRIEISIDNQNWSAMHSGITYFSGGASGAPLTVTLAGRFGARFIRLSLDERECLHLAQVEVFVRRDLIKFVEYRAQHALENLKLRIEDPAEPWWLYSLKAHSASDSNLPIIGLKIEHGGRFGNLLEQTTNAILLAEKTGLKYVQLARHDLMDPKGSISAGDLTLLPSNEALPSGGVFLCGVFLHMTDFAPSLSPSEAEHCRVLREIVRPYLLTGIQGHDRQFQDELTIHIRAGDIFQGLQSAWAWYRQPPLAFYKLIIDRLLAKGTIRRVRMVYEDRENPCILALEEYLTRREIPFRAQSGTLAEDLSALIDARHLAFGFGTFGYAVCKLSRQIETVHFFAPELNKFAMVGGSYRQIPGIDRVYSVYDKQGDYIKVGEWLNSPEQRELMCTYPVEALDIEETEY